MGRVLFWIAFAGLVLALPVAALVYARGPELPVYSELPPFELTSHEGHAFGTEQLRGRVWIANFIFTGCSAACPMLTRRMRSVQERLTKDDPEQKVGLLSITVDPQGDTPQRLAEYAARAEAKDGRWIFLTGDPDRVKKAVIGGFKIAMGTAPVGEEVQSDFEIIHGNHLVLIDAAGRIRGYYDADESGARKVADHALWLAQHSD